MELRPLVLVGLIWLLHFTRGDDETNRPPEFVLDMNNLALSENTQVGRLVYTLQGDDPEGSPVTYGIVGTDRFEVNPETGEVTLVKPLDREVNDTLKFIVSIEDQVEGSRDNNIVTVPITVIVLDDNDNAPLFKNVPYEANVPEDAEIGTTVIKDIIVEDMDSFGGSLEVGCLGNGQWAEACDMFKVVTIQSSQSRYEGSLVLNGKLNYNQKQFYQFLLESTDGSLKSTSSVEIRVVDIQNLPPVFVGATAGVVAEDANIGSTVLTLQARDGDRAHPRNLTLDLLNNPLDFFLLDSVTGELKTARPLDREALPDPSAPLNLTVRAREIVDGQPLDSELTTSFATITVTIRDVNDEPPRFNRREYSVEIPENIPAGTPLPNLDMVVTDTDMGLNSAFSLRLSDVSGAFSVEPGEASGSTQVSIRLNNTTLDYEDPNQRKFIILVIAEELHTSPRLSSTATVTVSVSDVNDNAPAFQQEVYSATVVEDAPASTHVLTIVASDRDHARFGTEGVLYQVFGNGAELFQVDNRTGVITLALCQTPGQVPCLDYETRHDYFLNYKATDDDGSGQTAVVPLKISLLDANDNGPTFDTPLYKASIDEDATKFEPELQVQARDIDATSEIRYSIEDSPESEIFSIDSISGRVSIRPGYSIQGNGNETNHILLRIKATDGIHNASSGVQITVRDVNNHAPVFHFQQYNASVMEDAHIGTEIAVVSATDEDSGMNAEIAYAIQKGASDAFAIHNTTGLVTTATKLDYDKKNTYHIHIIATDKGVQSLTGTTVLTVTVLNANDKFPYFTPQIQRAEVSADAEIGKVIHNLIAMDKDILSNEDLKYEMGDKPVTAVDKNGEEVKDPSLISSWFRVSAEGRVSVARTLDRSIAAVVTLPVTVTDTTAPSLQLAQGLLIITIVDVNRHPPVFPASHYSERLVEEQPLGTILGQYQATDQDSDSLHYAIQPLSEYFNIDNVTGVVRTTQRIDYERVRRMELRVVAYDAGAPPLSATTTVAVDVVNVNDCEPHFDSTGYEATVQENAAKGVTVVTVHASDDDEGQFGEVRYSLSGEHAAMFSMDAVTGEVRVAAGSVIDREAHAHIWLQAIAADNAPPATRKTASVPIHILVLDTNDNPPVFSQREYRASVADNLPLSPPAPILQVRAEDRDAGNNAQLAYSVLEQTEPGAFKLDPSSGIVYPAKAVLGNTTHELLVSATDGMYTDTARVLIQVSQVNQNRPLFVVPEPTQTTIQVPENAAQAELLVMTVKASDADAGENGRISYFLKLDNQNVHETPEFSINEFTGELRTKSFLDREQKDSYQLVLVATDNGSPAPFEALHFLAVILKDSNDNKPQFPKELYQFSVSENQTPGIIIGTVRGVDKDSGENGRVYYHIVDGNQQGAFTLDRMQGTLRANISFDREKISEYSLTVYASNEPILDSKPEELNSIEQSPTSESDNKSGSLVYKTHRDRNIAYVHINILDENDNKPIFDKNIYYAGIKYTAKVNELIVEMPATDLDEGANGTTNYLVAASNLYKFGNLKSSGSIMPSPFNVTKEGQLLTANYMAEYNQDRFVLEIIAQEIEPPHSQTRAQVYVWVVGAEQLVKVVISRQCSAAQELRESLQKQFSSAIGALVVMSAVKHYVHTSTLYEDWCEIHFHAVEQASWGVLTAEEVLVRVDRHYDQLRDFYREANIETVVSASASTATNKVRESFDPALAALIALLIVLFTGIVTFIVVCSCLKHWVIPPPSMDSSKSSSLARRRILEELSTTENPLWLENKLRPYEEQELTMHVFGDVSDPSLTGAQPPAPVSTPTPLVDNTYATIAGGGGGERDYATLAPPARRNESPTPLQAMLGFQGSTFQPTLLQGSDTPEPPPRPSAVGGPTQAP